MQQPTPRSGIPLQYLAAWVAVVAAIMLYMQGWPGSSVGRWLEVVVSSLVGGALLAWLHSRSGFRIK